ncbi:hypothetical protein QJS10_CPB20g01803 [Acorus calamus]|uniref:Uncharacterized protein n=1 Tax=Acorus calamus TaxID=4465 RepID=A0AAV9C9Y4_ACOCL|nr:hypothetical protein QJS10_CPB20g01803 [Acorus calamus]
MAMKPLTSKAIALTEKKMDMTLDDIIKMSKKSSSKGKKLPRASIKSRGFANEGPSRGNSFKMQRFMNTRSSVRQDGLAQRRMNLNGTQLPLITEFAGKAAAAPVQKKVVNRNRPRIMALPVREVGSTDGFFGKMNQEAAPPQTMDALFAGMKEQRMKFIAERIRANVGAGRGTSCNSNSQRQPQRQRQRRAGRDGSAFGRQFGNFVQ